MYLSQASIGHAVPNDVGLPGLLHFVHTDIGLINLKSSLDSCSVAANQAIE